MSLAEHLAFLEGDAEVIAPQLLGMVITTRQNGIETSVRIDEVEAYRSSDPASHTFRGRTERNQPMFESAGHVYVYRSYGIHWCMNIVSGAEGDGQAVLLRGGVPLMGVDTMQARRGRDRDVANGPGKLCQALGIDGSFSGTRLGDRLWLSGSPGTATWSAGPRIGIAVARDVPWRFVAVPEAG